MVAEQKKLWCIPFSSGKTREKGIHHRSGKKGIHHRASDPEKEKKRVVSTEGAPKERRRGRAEKRMSKGCFWRVRFFSAPLRFLLKHLKGPENLKGREKKTDSPKTPFGQPFLRTTPSPLLWRTPIHGGFCLPGRRPEFLFFSPKIDKGRSKQSFSGEGPRDPKISLALLQSNPKVAPVQVWGCSRARDNFGTLRPSPEKTTCCFPYRFSGKNRNSGLVPGKQNPK